MKVFETTPTLSQSETIKTWPSTFPPIKIIWEDLYHKAGDEISNSNRDYKYDTTTKDLSLFCGNKDSCWGTDNPQCKSMKIGTPIRTKATAIIYEGQSGKEQKIVSVDYDTTKKDYKNENALRLSTRDMEYPLDRNSKEYLRWAASFKDVSYEWGGRWYGGMTGNNVGGGDGYQGFGIDCSGLVSASAKWSGYNWSPWRRTTSTLYTVSTPIDLTKENIQPGDILLRVDSKKGGNHVVSVIEISGDNVEIIEASPSNLVNKVRKITRDLKKYYLNDDYIPRKLNQ